MKMRGMVGLSDYKGGGFLAFVAKCIRFFTKSMWTHTFCITMDDELLGPIVEEAGPMGVVNASIDDYVDGPYIFRIWKVLASDDQIDAGIRRVFPMLNKSYGYFQLLGFILVWIWYKLTLRKANNPIRGGIICSELVLEYLRAIFPNEVILQNMDRNTTSPEDIYEFIMERPDLFTEVLYTQ